MTHLRSQPGATASLRLGRGPLIGGMVPMKELQKRSTRKVHLPVPTICSLAQGPRFSGEPLCI